MAASHKCRSFIAEGTALRRAFFSSESDGLPRAHDCPDPRDQLPRRERLRHAVVGAELEQDHVRTDLARQPQSVGAVRRQDDVVALLREVVADELGDLAGHDDVRAFLDVDRRPWDEREAVRPEDASFVRIRAQQVLVDGLEVSGVEELGERDAVQLDSLRHPDHPLDRS